MGLKQIDHGSKEYKQVIQLRYSVMREPLGLGFTEEELEMEAENIHIAAFEDEEILGCCMLSKVDNDILQLRQMAVKDKLQRKGIGGSILAFAENVSRDKGFKKIIMHSRDTAVGFYEKFGYKIKGEPFIEVKIPHRIMEKAL
ncbi:MAG: GNAT family N-acetyltransferase [Ferruginibacter sp.]|jgi:N-acetylglutamate synthase-like GNAT family acetyltransferase